jgi:hypothetical protein
MPRAVFTVLLVSACGGVGECAAFVHSRPTKGSVPANEAGMRSDDPEVDTYAREHGQLHTGVPSKPRGGEAFVSDP